MTINPMQSAHDAPRCKAKSKRTGNPCRAPAVRGCRVCRMHGARGGAPTGERNGNYRDGTRTKDGSRWLPMRVTMVQRVLGIVGQQNRCHSEPGGSAWLHRLIATASGATVG